MIQNKNISPSKQLSLKSLLNNKSENHLQDNYNLIKNNTKISITNNSSNMQNTSNLYNNNNKTKQNTQQSQNQQQSKKLYMKQDSAISQSLNNLSQQQNLSNLSKYMVLSKNNNLLYQNTSHSDQNLKKYPYNQNQSQKSQQSLTNLKQSQTSLQNHQTHQQSTSNLNLKRHSNNNSKRLSNTSTQNAQTNQQQNSQNQQCQDKQSFILDNVQGMEKISAQVPLNQSYKFNSRTNQHDLNQKSMDNKNGQKDQQQQKKGMKKSYSIEKNSTSSTSTTLNPHSQGKGMNISYPKTIGGSNRLSGIHSQNTNYMQGSGGTNNGGGQEYMLEDSYTSLSQHNFSQFRSQIDLDSVTKRNNIEDYYNNSQKSQPLNIKKTQSQKQQYQSGIQSPSIKSVVQDNVSEKSHSIVKNINNNNTSNNNNQNQVQNTSSGSGSKNIKNNITNRGGSCGKQPQKQQTPQQSIKSAQNLEIVSQNNQTNQNNNNTTTTSSQLQMQQSDAHSKKSDQQLKQILNNYYVQSNIAQSQPTQFDTYRQSELSENSEHKQITNYSPLLHHNHNIIPKNNNNINNNKQNEQKPVSEYQFFDNNSNNNQNQQKQKQNTDNNVRPALSQMSLDKLTDHPVSNQKEVVEDQQKQQLEIQKQFFSSDLKFTNNLSNSNINFNNNTQTQQQQQQQSAPNLKSQKALSNIKSTGKISTFNIFNTNSNNNNNNENSILKQEEGNGNKEELEKLRKENKELKIQKKSMEDYVDRLLKEQERLNRGIELLTGEKITIQEYLQDLHDVIPDGLSGHKIFSLLSQNLQKYKNQIKNSNLVQFNNQQQWEC